MRTRSVLRAAAGTGQVLVLILVHLLAATPATLAQSDEPAIEPGDRAGSHRDPTTTPKPGGLRMSRAIVCKSIDGFENYQPLPGAAQTSDEKLLIYYRPMRYKIDDVDGFYTAHLIQDNEIRKKGRNEIVRQKKKVVEFRPRQKQPLGPFYIKNTISLKGLHPGEYELTIILRDQLAKGSPPSKQVVKFRVIRANDPRATAASKKDETAPAGP